METYRIVRFFETGEKLFVQGGLMLEEAQKWCSSEWTSGVYEPEIVGMNVWPNSKGLTKNNIRWFDGFESEGDND